MAVAVTAIVTLAAGLTAVEHSRDHSQSAAPAAAAPDPWTALQQSGIVLDGVRFDLHDGHGTAPEAGSAVLLPDHTTGDLDGDGTTDVVGIVQLDSVGSGRFFYLVALREVGSTPTVTPGLFLGDRIEPTSIDLSDGHLEVSFLTRALTTSYADDYDRSVTATYALAGTRLHRLSSTQSRLAPANREV